MGLYFYRKDVCVPVDHCIHGHLDKFAERFDQKRLHKDWIIEGPFEDEEDECYYFMIHHKSSQTCAQCSIPTSDFLFEPNKVEKWISSVISRCMEIEFSTSTVSRLMGASQDEIDADESSETYVIGDYSRGEADVEIRQRPKQEDGNVENKTSGGIIIP